MKTYRKTKRELYKDVLIEDEGGVDIISARKSFLAILYSMHVKQLAECKLLMEPWT